MTLRDEDLRHLFRSYVGKKGSQNRERCPSLEDLFSFFEPRTRTREKLKIIDHLTNCSACAEEFEFFLGLQDYQNQIIQGVQRIQPREPLSVSSPTSFLRTGSFWRFSPIAVGVLLIVISLIIMTQKGKQPSDIRAPVLSVTLIQPSQNHPGSWPLTFKWQEVRGAEHYILELYDESLLLLWKSPETEASGIALPKDISGGLQLEKPYFWMITAYRNKRKLAESELMRFVMSAKDP